MKGNKTSLGICALFIIIGLFRFTYANPYNPHVSPTKGPFVEGWYSRILDFESNHSFGILFGRVMSRDKDPFFGRYALNNVVSLFHSRGDDSSMEVFRGSPSSDDVKVTSQGKLVTMEPDFKSSASFEWEAKSYGFFQVNEQETRFNFTNINGVSFIGILGAPNPWGPYGEGPEGWTDEYPLHWYVYSLGSELINYNWVNEQTGEMLRGRQGVVFQQKVWGTTFPLAWVWAQGFHWASRASFALSLGVLGTAGFSKPIHLIGYRSSAITLNFRPSNSRLRKNINECSGVVSATVTSHTHQLEFEINAPPSSFQAGLLRLNENDFSPVCVETYIASAFFHVYKRTQQRYELIESGEFHLAALELGGLYVCQE